MRRPARRPTPPLLAKSFIRVGPARLAILADALEEQGADERLVAALRPDGRPRPAGLWALRQVLEVNGERP